MIRLQALTYIEGHGRTTGIIWNDTTGTLTLLKGPDTMLNQNVLSMSTAVKCAPMQAVRQTELGRASTNEEKKCSSFQTNYD